MADKVTYDAGSISVLEGLEAVRKRPGMYIGSVSRKGLNHLIYEIVDNAVDEHLAGACSEIKVTLEADGSCTVEDNGRGIPVGMHEKGVPAARLVFSTLHAGGKFDDSVYKTSGGLHGVGSSVVNALSTYLDVQISRDGAIHHDRYERGVAVEPLVDGLLPIIGKTKKTGTKINFLPDPEIFEKTRFKEDEVKSRLHETAYLNPKLTIIYEDLRGEEPADAAENAMAYLEACIAEQNSSGGVVECIISGVPAGIGDPVFEKLNANLAKAVMSIGAVKGFEIGDGFDVAKATGKNNNDAFRIGADGSVSKETNHAGGILGGMSDGSDIILRATIKPTPSISATQHTVNKSGEEIDINIKGRHDPIIVPRAVVVVESMAAITIVDAMFANMSARMDSLERFYK